ncbi:MAG: exodeoxyribonuclease VII small subunit, partial [Rhodospirillaceae bacterium]
MSEPGSTPPLADPAAHADIAKMSFEQALTALEDIVRSLEGGRVDLDRSVEAYERGVLLKRHCEEKLAEAKAKVERITIG